MPAVKPWLKEHVPAARRLLRPVSRLRWLTKRQALRDMDAPLADPRSLRFLLWDPEVESYSYDVANVDELVAFCAEAFGIEPDQARRHVEEVHADPWLTGDLRRRTRWRFDLKTQPPIAQRVVWWVLVRARRPRLVVETGIYEGLGTVVLLAALERNAAEGGPDARLLSVDSDEHAGFLVPERLKARWEKVVGFTSDVLEPAVGDRQVDVLLHDTPHTYDVQSAEFAVALRHTADALTIVDNSGGQTSALHELAAPAGVPIRYFWPEPVDHPYTPSGVDVATFGASPAGPGEDFVVERPRVVTRPWGAR